MVYFSLTKNIVVRQANNKDLSPVADFLHKAMFNHRHLDWKSILEWIDSPPFLLMCVDNEIQAIVSASPDPPGVAWVHCYAVKNAGLIDRAWKTLSPEVDSILHSLNAPLYALGLEEWFIRLLKSNGFVQSQEVVVLNWNHKLTAEPICEKEIIIRPMLESDLEQVAQVDQKAFESQWVNSAESIRMAYLQSGHASIAEIDNEIIGYELSTASQFSGHLARLAVLPEYQGRRIGKRMVWEMLSFFSSRGILQVTVNTQNDNQSSLHLYKSLGFYLTGEKIPVFSRDN